LRLAALLPDDVDAVRATARRLRLSNAQRDRLVAVCGGEPPIDAAMSPRAVRRAVYLLGAPAFIDRAMLAWAADPSTAATPAWRALIAQATSWTPPVLPVSGEDAGAAGVPRGPLVGRVLREVERWWIEADFPEDRGAALARVKAVARELAGENP
jgi:poly(A) polymerase